MIEKIKQFFKDLLGIENQEYLEEPKFETSSVNNIKMSNNEFQQRIEIMPDLEKEKALKLQKDYKDGLIFEEDLSEEEFNLLSNLYESQIEETKDSIETYRNKILKLQGKLSINT